MTPADLRVVFMGTPDYAVPTLEALIEHGCQVVAAVSQPDKPQGRGRVLKETPVAQCAKSHNLPIYQWPHLNNESFRILSELKPDLMVVVAYGRILPKRYLEMPRFGCFNGHGSLLPRWRGAAPIQWALCEGDAETGVTIMQMSVGMDEGDAVWVRRTEILPDETSEMLFERLSHISAQAMIEAIDHLLDGTLTATPQSELGGEITLAPPLLKDFGKLDFSWPAQKLINRLRGCTPWPGTFIPTAEGPLKIHGMRIAGPLETPANPGTIVAHTPDGPRVACGDGSVILTSAQRPGRRVTTGRECFQPQSYPQGFIF